jgi:hypothetical protein
MNVPAKFVGEYPHGVFNREYVEHIEAELRQCRADLASIIAERDEYKASFRALLADQPLLDPRLATVDGGDEHG